MVKLIIWDYDGTIAQTHDAIVYSLATALSEKALPVEDSAKISHLISLGLGLEDTIRQLTHHPRPEDVISRYREIYSKDGWRYEAPFPGLLTAISEIAQLDIHQIVLSNKGTEAVEDAMRRFDLNSLFDLIIGADPRLKRKPDPMVFHTVIRAKYPEITADEVLVVGDTEADIRFARNIGAKSCWAAYGYGDRGVCSGLRPSMVIQTPEDIISSLDLLLECA